jgi:hypothetical protein
MYSQVRFSVRSRFDPVLPSSLCLGIARNICKCGSRIGVGLVRFYCIGPVRLSHKLLRIYRRLLFRFPVRSLENCLCSRPLRTLTLMLEELSDLTMVVSRVQSKWTLKRVFVGKGPVIGMLRPSPQSRESELNKVDLVRCYISEYLNLKEMTRLCRAFLEKLIPQLTPVLMKPETSLPCSHKHAIGTHPDTFRSNPRPQILFA